MENEKRTVRLIYPQWQGGDIVRWVPEIRNPDDAARGYFLGAQLLAFLAPHSSVRTLTVPIAEDIVFYLEARVLKHHDTGPAEEK